MTTHVNAAASSAAPLPAAASTVAPATTGSSGFRSTKKTKGGLPYVDDHLTTVKEYYDKKLLVAIDPGVRDVFYAASIKGNYARITTRELEKITRTERDRRILNRVKAEHPEVLAAEEELSKHDFSTTDGDELFAALKCWGKHHKTLSEFYGHGGPKTQPGNRGGGGQPIYLKFRINAHINRQRRNAYIAKKLFDAFGDKKTGEFPLLVMGDWAGRHMRSHAPIRSSGLCKMLVAHGFKVMLIDEYLTSKICSMCSQRMQNLKQVSRARPPFPDGRPEPIMKCHGLLFCTSPKCIEYVQDRLKDKPILPETGERAADPKPVRPKRRFRIFTARRKNACMRRNERADQEPRPLKKVNRTRWHDVTNLLEGFEYARRVNRDKDAARSMLVIIESLIEGHGRPEAYRRPGNTNERTADSQASSGSAPAAKRRRTGAARAPRKCSQCHQPGHDKRNCPELNNTPGESSKKRTTDSSASNDGGAAVSTSAVPARPPNKPADDSAHSSRSHKGKEPERY
ncbi:hypothetical protein H4R19_002328 [Coemansia spiralis]|nr:hypothetical protein H4R19_002328 [Coemansia spiralis]